MKVGDPFSEDTTVGATISRQQADKVLHYIDIAKKEVCMQIVMGHGGGVGLVELMSLWF